MSEYACCDKSPNCDCEERYEKAQEEGLYYSDHPEEW